jgi:hypothetical protein
MPGVSLEVGVDSRLARQLIAEKMKHFGEPKRLSKLLLRIGDDINANVELLII